MSQNEPILPGPDDKLIAAEVLKNDAPSRWPGPDDKIVVTEMLKDGASPHWQVCHDFVTHLVRGINIPEALKDDIVQEAMKVLPKALPHFHYESRLTTWLVKIVYSKTSSALRDYQRRGLNETSLTISKEDDEVPSIFEIVAPRTTEDECLIRERLREAVAVLKMYAKRRNHAARDIEILRMVLIEDRTSDEVARALSINPQVVRRVVREARQYLHWHRT